MTIQSLACSALAGSSLGGLTGFIGSLPTAETIGWLQTYPIMDPIITGNNCSWNYGNIYSIDCSQNANATVAELLGQAYKIHGNKMADAFIEYAPTIVAATAGIGLVVGVSLDCKANAYCKKRDTNVAPAIDDEMPRLVEPEKRDVPPTMPLITPPEGNRLSRCCSTMFNHLKRLDCRKPPRDLTQNTQLANRKLQYHSI